MYMSILGKPTVLMCSSLVHMNGILLYWIIHIPRIVDTPPVNLTLLLGTNVIPGNRSFTSKHTHPVDVWVKQDCPCCNAQMVDLNQNNNKICFGQKTQMTQQSNKV